MEGDPPSCEGESHCPTLDYVVGGLSIPSQERLAELTATNEHIATQYDDLLSRVTQTPQVEQIEAIEKVRATRRRRIASRSTVPPLP